MGFLSVSGESGGGDIVSSLMVLFNLTYLTVIKSRKIETDPTSCSEGLEFEFLHLQ